MALETRRADFTLAAQSVDREARTAELLWTTGARVPRQTWDGLVLEELSLDAAAVDMGRLTSGRAPLLASHGAGSLDGVIGVVESARLEKGQGIARVRFSKDPEADRVFQKVAEGILTNVSVGYRVVETSKAEGTPPVIRVTRWEPHELSIVALPADAGAYVRSLPQSPGGTSPAGTNQENHPVETENQTPETPPDPRADRERTVGILAAVRAAKLGDAFADKLITDGVSLDAARAQVLEAMATRSEAFKTEQHTSPFGGELGHAGMDSRIRTMAEALAARMTGASKVSEQARQYLPLSPVDMARHLLEVRGVSTRLMSKSRIIDTAMATRSGPYAPMSDFPSLLTETGNRIVRNEYLAYTGGIRAIAKRASDVSDFRPKVLLQLSAAGELPVVAENAEFHNFPLTEAKSSYSIATYGGIFSLSRQAIVNDDTGAFSDMARKLGRAAANTLSTLLASKLTSNPTMPDGLALFHATHGNLAGTGAVISVASIGAGIKAMRYQTDIDGKTLIDARPRFLVVPAALETVALQTMGQVNATQASNVNPFTTQLTVIVDPRLDASSAIAWYLAADPQLIDTIEYVEGLDGADGPQVVVEQGFRIDGTSWRVRQDMGAGVVDHRGLYRNPGA